MKLMNTHMHLMEALTTYVRAGAGHRARERLAELIAIESQAVIRHGWMAGTDRHQRDWTPVIETTGPAATRISYGHDLENIWLIVDALRALDQPVAPYLSLFRGLFETSMRLGWDERGGGFFDSGVGDAPADRRARIWWVQAEALVSALTMFELTGEARYADVFVKTLAVRRRDPDRLDLGRVARGDRAGRPAAARQQGARVEGRLSQRPRADRIARAHRSPVYSTVTIVDCRLKIEDLD